MQGTDAGSTPAASTMTAEEMDNSLLGLAHDIYVWSIRNSLEGTNSWYRAGQPTHAVGCSAIDDELVLIVDGEAHPIEWTPDPRSVGSFDRLAGALFDKLYEVIVKPALRIDAEAGLMPLWSSG